MFRDWAFSALGSDKGAGRLRVWDAGFNKRRPDDS